MFKGEKYDWPILSTGTVVPSALAISKVNDPVQRELEYKSVLRWLAVARTGIDKVVFCENSNFDLSSWKDIHELYQSKNRQLEAYNVPMPDESQFSGKGWGEGAIIEWALKNIKVLAESKYFIKITGRYQIQNLRVLNNIIQKSIRKYPDMKFISQSFTNGSKPHMHTEFFWCDREFYIEHLCDTYKDVKDNSGIYLEHTMAKKLVALNKSYRIGVMPIPLISDSKVGCSDEPFMSKREIIEHKFKQALYPTPLVRRLAA